MFSRADHGVERPGRSTVVDGRRRVVVAAVRPELDGGRFPVKRVVGDVLDVAVIVRDIGRTSVKLTVHAFKDGAECVRATFVTVTTSLLDHKSIALPDDMRLAMKNYQARCDQSASPASTSLRYGPSSLPA